MKFKSSAVELFFFLESCLESGKKLILHISDPWFHFPIFFAVFPCNDPIGLDGQVSAHEWFLEEFQFSVMALAYAGFKKVTTWPNLPKQC
jgi:hypothetical protein